MITQEQIEQLKTATLECGFVRDMNDPKALSAKIYETAQLFLELAKDELPEDVKKKLEEVDFRISRYARAISIEKINPSLIANPGNIRNYLWNYLCEMVAYFMNLLDLGGNK